MPFPFGIGGRPDIKRTVPVGLYNIDEMAHGYGSLRIWGNRTELLAFNVVESGITPADSRKAKSPGFLQGFCGMDG
ncbi:MAG TPA: hypothetical protein VK014_13725, partial [Cyclobacteriaceae bacterium]|nr:hypothetical protein [Cyclobacteriaceae bacterium]